MGEIGIGEDLRKELDRLALGCRVLAMEGHNDISLGHVSMRDPEGRGLWLKRRFLGLDEIRGPDDFVLLDFAGKQLYGPGISHSEWPIHAEIMRSRPEVKVVGHTHPFHACLFAATNEPLQPISLEGIYFGMKAPHYKGTSNLIDTPALGQDLAQALGGASLVFMKNHGLAFVGSTIAEAVVMGIWAERACKQQLVLNGSGLPWSGPEREDWEGKAETIGNLGLWANFFAYFCRKVLRQEGAVAEAERLRAGTLAWRRQGEHLTW